MVSDFSSAEPPVTAVTGLTQRLARNLMMQSGTQVMNLVISIASVWVLTRELTVPEYGGFNYMLIAITVGLSFTDLGITTILLRDLAQRPERTESLVQTTLGLQLALSVLPTLGLWALSWLMLEGDLRLAVIVYSLVLPIQAMALPAQVLRARVLIKRSVVAEVSNRLSGFVLMIAAVYAGFGVVGAASALIIGELAGLVAVLLMTRVFVRPIPRVDPKAWRVILRTSAAVGLVILLTTLVNRLDVFMLERLGGLAEVAIYSAAYRLPNLLERFPLLAMVTLYPLMSRLALDDPSGLRGVYRWSISRAAAIALPIVLVVLIFAPRIISLWMGPDYAGSVTPMRWLIVSTGCMYVSVIAGNVLNAVGRPRGSLVAWGMAAPVNIVLNWFWIPRYGAAGAAAATAVSFVIAMGISLWMAERHLSRAVAG